MLYTEVLVIICDNSQHQHLSLAFLILFFPLLILFFRSTFLKVSVFIYLMISSVCIHVKDQTPIDISCIFLDISISTFR